MHRRGFLGGLLVAPVTITAGKFVITDPKVVSGNLLVPNPEPTIIRADRMPERVVSAGQAFISSMRIDQNAVNVSLRGDAWNTYVAGQLSCHVELEMILDGSDASAQMRPLWQMEPGDTVRLFVVKAHG